MKIVPSKERIAEIDEQWKGRPTAMQTILRDNDLELFIEHVNGFMNEYTAYGWSIAGFFNWYEISTTPLYKALNEN